MTERIINLTLNLLSLIFQNLATTLNWVLNLIFIVTLFGFFFGILKLIVNILFKNIKDEFSNYYDRAFPLLLILLPLISIYFSHISLTEKLFFIVIIYGFIIYPFLKFYSIFRDWDQVSSSDYTWYHPSIVFKILEALVYPFIFGVYLIFIRYLRLDTTINVFDYIFKYSEILSIAFSTIMFWLPLCFAFILPKLAELKQNLWEKTLNLLSAVHIELLRYNVYVILCQKMHKFCFFCVVSAMDFYLVFPHSMPDFQFSRITALRYLVITFVNYITEYKYRVSFCVFLFMLLEILMNQGNIYYGLYLILIYPLILSISNLILIYSNYNLAESIAFSDYLRKAKTLKNPHYYWWAMRAEIFPMTELNEHSEEVLKEKALVLKKEAKIATLVPFSSRMSYFFMRITNNNDTNFSKRLAIHYRKFNNIRWVHTSKVLPPLKETIHPHTALFTKDIVNLSYYGLNNNDWRKHMDYATQPLVYSRNFKVDETYFRRYNKNIANINFKGDSLLQYYEIGHISKFLDFCEKHNIYITGFDYNLHQQFSFRIQRCPDLIMFLKKSTRDKLMTIALDWKTTAKIGTGYNTARTYMTETPIKYTNVLDTYEKQFFAANRNMSFAHKILYQKIFYNLKLAANKENFLEIWYSNLEYFDSDFLPPITFGPTNNIDLNFLSPDILAKLTRAPITIEQLSEFLYKQKFPIFANASELKPYIYESQQNPWWDNFITKINDINNNS